ncbi:zinc finger protein 106 isoform X2 [Pleurodeles waltl]
MPHRDWKWGSEGFGNLRKGNFQHPSQSPNSSHYPRGAKGRGGWQLIPPAGPANRHQVLNNPGTVWHSKRGGAVPWNHSGTIINHNWNPESGASFPMWHPGNPVGNWSSAPCAANGWNDGFQPGRNRMDDMGVGWNTNRGRPINYNQMRYTWERPEKDHATALKPYGNRAEEQCNKSMYPEDYTSDHLPLGTSFQFTAQEKSEYKTTKYTAKGTNPSKDKPHRWSPYPSQKAAENQPPTEDVSGSSEKEPQKLLKNNETNKSDSFPKLSANEDLCQPKSNHLDADPSNPFKESADTASERRSEQDNSKSSRMPPLKCPLLPSPNKRPTQKREAASVQNSVKPSLPASPRESRTRLSALNLETVHTNSYTSKLRSASCRSPANKASIDTPQKESMESLSEVLRKAKEILQSSQSMRSQHLLKSYKKQAEEVSNSDKVSKNSEMAAELHVELLDNISDEELSDYERSGSKSKNTCLFGDTLLPCKDKSNEDRNNFEISGNFSSTSDVTAGPNKCVPHTVESKEPPLCLLENLERTSLESEFSEDQLQADAQVESDGDRSNVCDQDMQKGASQQPLLPPLSKLGLPVSLQRDLTRHMCPKSKATAHPPEPNLNNARRIRNVSGHRKSETEKESGLKPTLRQILNASRRNVNWEQVIQHVTKKKQELGKGLPRFGIEMVAPVQNEQEEFDMEEDSQLSNFEGFHWEAITVPLPGTARKRSLSESSVVVDRTSSVYALFSDQAADRGKKRQDVLTSQLDSVPLGPNGSEDMQTEAKPKATVCPASSPSPEVPAAQHSTLSPVAVASVKREQSPEQRLDNQKTTEILEEGHSLVPPQALTLPTSSSVDAATDSSCASSTEQNDSQSVGKKRRATLDCSPEIPNLERKNKRRKIKGKKERSQVDQLLSISLREEELSRSLQSLDTKMLQARATLQAAYVEVQHLMVLKQQITMEMSAMRTQRIQILQGLQETLDNPEHADSPVGRQAVEKNSNLQAAATAGSSPSNIFSLLLEQPAYISPHTSPSSAGLGTPLQVRTPPAFQAPGRVTAAAPDSSALIKRETPSAQGGRMDKSIFTVQAGSVQLPGLIGQNSFQSTPEESSTGKSNSRSTEIHSQPQSSQTSVAQGSNSVLEGALLQKPTSVFPCHPLPGQTSVVKDSNYCLDQSQQQAISTIALVEEKGSKKKKKLRKKKTLKAAHVPENSDTEQDISCNPVRKLKCKKMTKEGKVTTSTSFDQEESSTALGNERNKDENDSDSSVEVVEVSNPTLEIVAIDSAPEEAKPDSPSKRDPLSNTEKRLVEVARSGYDEVSSTSEMGANYRNGVLRSVPEVRIPISSVKGSKNSSEVSSEPGEDEDPTEGNFEGHQAAVNAIQIFGGLLYTCSADKTVNAYNLVSRKRVAIFEGHTSKVNCLLITLTSGKKSVLYTGSSDHTIRCYNIKTQECTNQFHLDDRVVCLHARWRILFAGLANGCVITFSIKSGKQLDTFECHGPRAVSCLASAQEGSRRLLLVGSYDCTISVRDAQNGLLLRTLEGHSKTVLCMKVVNDLVFSGSSDQSVHAHNIHTGELVRIYKGHNHAVTVVNILGKVMVTASLDKFVRVYELQSHDRLQVYGGHKDMIMCMTIHKSMIYTGCYDGSIQAVRLNLLQNYRCWWHGCSLIFGVVDHLKQHLLTDHTNANFQTLKCRWKSCDAFFTARRGSKQDAAGHIERHAEEDSKIDT